MVKNDGGNKGKGLARKHVNAAKCGGSKQLRVATQEAEHYAVVSKMLGNGMCYVRLLSGNGGSASDKLCIIRNKFKGRGKRDNILDSGSWVLVGMREWASKQDTCDLLEVYNHGERDRLMKNEPCFKSVVPDENTADIASSVQFADSTTLKYSQMMKDRDSDDSDSDVLHQREYNMPSDDSDDDSDDNNDDDSDEVIATVATVAVKAAPKLKVDHINVDDI
jgi:translation initiation factor IF-1